MKHLLKTSLMLLLLFGALTLTHLDVTAQIVQNGDFENANTLPANGGFVAVGQGSTNLTGWTVSNNSIDLHDRLHLTTRPMLGNNQRHIDLNNNGQVLQNVNLVPGATYSLSFITSYHSWGPGGTCSASVQIANLNDTWARTFNNQVGQWITRNYTFVAGATNTLTFTGLSSNYQFGGILIDAVVIEPLDPCDASIDIDTVGCDQYAFSLITPNLTNVSSILSIDGTDILNPAFPIELSQGMHEICFSYFGYDFLHETICCDSVCTNLFVEGVDTIADTVSYCDIMASLGYTFDPCVRNPGYPSYQINAGGITSCQPATEISLPEGVYTIRYYDDNSCVRLVEYLTVEREDPIVMTCYREVILPCDYAAPSYEYYVPTTGSGDCDCDYDNGDEYYDEIILISQDSEGNVVLTKKFYNFTKCSICTVVYTIIEEACNFTPHIFMDFNTETSDQVRFMRSSPTVACSTETWRLKDINGNVLQTIVHNPAPNPPSLDSFVGLTPGQTYILEMEVCVCICETPCCKTKEVTFIFDPSQPARFYEDSDTKFSDGLPYESSDKVPFGFNNLEIKLVPNPTASTFRIISGVTDDLTFDRVSVYDLSGHLIHNVDDYSPDTLIDLGPVAPGTYLVNIKKNSAYQTLKIVKE